MSRALSCIATPARKCTLSASLTCPRMSDSRSKACVISRIESSTEFGGQPCHPFFLALVVSYCLRSCNRGCHRLGFILHWPAPTLISFGVLMLASSLWCANHKTEVDAIENVMYLLLRPGFSGGLVFGLDYFSQRYRRETWRYGQLDYESSL